MGGGGVAPLEGARRAHLPVTGAIWVCTRGAELAKRLLRAARDVGLGGPGGPLRDEQSEDSGAVAESGAAAERWSRAE